METNNSFIVHGTYCVSNWGGYEIQLDEAGEMARMRDAFGGDEPAKISEWVRIEFDQEGEPIIDPTGYNIPLSEVVRAERGSHGN
jgi:hypothetical protein